MKIGIGKILKNRMVEKKQKTPQIEIKYRWEASEDYTLHQLEYQQTEIMLMAIKQLKKIPRTEQLESYLIEYMTEIEDEYTVVGKYILEYL